MLLRFVDASGREENKFIKLKISVLNQNSPQNDENITWWRFRILFEAVATIELLIEHLYAVFSWFCE